MDEILHLAYVNYRDRYLELTKEVSTLESL